MAYDEVASGMDKTEYRMKSEVWNVYIHWGSMEDKKLHEQFIEWIKT
jgi:hypothetical protein